MSISSAKQDLLSAVFSSMPEKLSHQLYKTFELAKENGDTSLPFELLLGLFPAQLSDQDIELLFSPVSALLNQSASCADQLSYEFLRKIWKLYCQDIAPDLARTWKDSVTSLRQNQAKLAAELRIMRENEGGLSKMISIFGEQDALKIPLIYRILTFAKEIDELVSAWPDQIKNLDDRYLLPLRDLNDLLVENDPDITPNLLFLLKVRLCKPQQILRAIQRLTRQNTDLMIVNTDMNIIIEVLLDEAEEILEHSTQQIENNDQIEQIDEDLETFGNIIAGSIEEFEISKKSAWGKRLYGISNRAVQMWTQRSKNAWLAIDKAMPRAKTKSFFGGSLSGPDLRQEVTTKMIEEAVLSTVLLKNIFQHASRLGFSAARDEVTQALEDRLREQENNLIDALADPGELDTNVLQNHFSILMKIKSAFHGKKAAQTLSRRGASALAAAA